MNVANRITALADANDIEFMERGDDRNDIDAIAEQLDIELEYAGNDDNALDVLEAAIAAAN